MHCVMTLSWQATLYTSHARNLNCMYLHGYYLYKMAYCCYVIAVMRDTQNVIYTYISQHINDVIITS